MEILSPDLATVGGRYFSGGDDSSVNITNEIDSSSYSRRVNSYQVGDSMGSHAKDCFFNISASWGRVNGSLKKLLITSFNVIPSFLTVFVTQNWQKSDKE